MNVNSLLKSPALGWVANALMIINILGYISVGSIECIVIFAVAYYLLKHVTKNHNLVILGGLLVSNVLLGCGVTNYGLLGKVLGPAVNL